MGLQRAESPMLLVPRRAEGPGHHDENHEADRAPPPDRRRQEHGGAELPEEAGLYGDPAHQRPSEGEAGDRRPELHLALARAPDRAGAAAARQRHPDPERQAPDERARAGGGEDPPALVLEIGELEDRESERADHERERRGARVLRVTGHERLAERAHEAEARALEDDAERDAEEQEDALRDVAGARVDERRHEHDPEQQRADPWLTARPRVRRRQVDPRSTARPLGLVLRLPDQVAQPEERARAEPEHHAETGEGERACRREEATDVAAEGEDGADAHHEPAEGTLHELTPRRDTHGELARQERGHEAAQEDARVQQRPGVEPRSQEIGPAHDPETGQRPVAPVAHAVRRGPRAVEGEEEDVDRGDEHGRPPDGPGAAEEHRVLRRERAAHQPVVTSSAARRTGRRPPTPPAPRSGAPTASRTPRGPSPSLGRWRAARSSHRARPS